MERKAAPSTKRFGLVPRSGSGFAYEHLPAYLQAVSKPFGDLARELALSLPANADSTTALRKLLEAKDCAVRAVLFKPAAD